MRYGQLKPAPGCNIDLSHPLARGLVSAILMNEGAGAPVDLVGNVKAGLSGSPKWAIGIDGPCFTTAGGNSYTWHSKAPLTLAGAKGDFTVFFRCSPTATGKWAGCTNNFAWGYKVGGWSMEFPGFTDCNSTQTATTGRWYSVVMSYTNKTSVRFVIYNHDSGSITSELVTTSVAPSASSGGIIGSDGGSSWNGSISATMLWSRALSLDEAIQLLLNPYAHFKSSSIDRAVEGIFQAPIDISVVTNYNRAIRAEPTVYPQVLNKGWHPSTPNVFPPPVDHLTWKSKPITAEPKTFEQVNNAIWDPRKVAAAPPPPVGAWLPSMAKRIHAEPRLFEQIKYGKWAKLYGSVISVAGLPAVVELVTARPHISGASVYPNGGPIPPLISIRPVTLEKISTNPDGTIQVVINIG